MSRLGFLQISYRQRQVSFYRFTTFVCFSLSLMILFWNNSVEKLKCFPDDFETNEADALRKQVLQENTDEFLQDILQELTYFEVNLHSKNQWEWESGYASIYDKILEKDESRVKLELGQRETNTSFPPEMQPEVDKAIRKDGMNTILSKMISVNRTVPDNREAACLNLTYDVTSLPSLSVIIIYSEEPFTAIVRTIHSVINRTPPKLLQEVILVDDFSHRLELQHKLERYLATQFPRNTVRLLKISNTRGGLIRARMIGAHVAIGDVLMFLDAHCEVNQNWAEPLLQRIKEKGNTVVAPVIDKINKNTMLYEQDGSGYVHVGGFSWNGLFYWIKIPDYERKRKKYHHEPTRTPVIAGGLFAIDRKYFWEIGSYDSGMQVWGGENVEISLRVWQCGGSMEIIPCSRVGHIFRQRVPYKYPNDYDTVGVNTARMAEVWMDEYKEIFYMHRIEQRDFGYGDISKRLILRKKLNCKSFQWYLDNVYKQKFKSYLDSKYYGQVRNPETNLCLDDMQNEAQGTYFLELYECHKKVLGSQLFFLSKHHHLRKEFVCASLPSSSDINQVEMRDCEQEGSKDPDLWEYNKLKKKLIHTKTKKCLTLIRDGDKTKAVLETCRRNLSDQHWIFVES